MKLIKGNEAGMSPATIESELISLRCNARDATSDKNGKEAAAMDFLINRCSYHVKVKCGRETGEARREARSGGGG